MYILEVAHMAMRGQTCPFMVHIWSIYSRISYICGSYMAIYGSYMAIYSNIWSMYMWQYMGHI